MMFNLQNCALKVFFLFFHILSLNCFSLQHPSIGAAAAAHHRRSPLPTSTVAAHHRSSPPRLAVSVRAWPFPARVLRCPPRRAGQGTLRGAPARSHHRFHQLEGQSPLLNCSDAARALHHCRSLSPPAFTSTSRPPPAPLIPGPPAARASQ